MQCTLQTQSSTVNIKPTAKESYCTAFTNIL